MPNVFANSSTCETVGKRGGRLMGVLPLRAQSWMATDFGRLSWQHGSGPSPEWPDHGLSSSGGPLYNAASSAARRSEGEILACGICLFHNARLVTAKIITVLGGCHARITSPGASRRSGCGSWDERVHAAGMADDGGG